MENWKPLESLAQWQEIRQLSFEKPVLVFKHSTRCSISQMALDRWNRSWKSEDGKQMDAFYLDLLNHRDVSNAIASDTGVEHQSPQAILLVKGEPVLSETHQSIRLENFREAVPA
jgi:bacillithiol system protein YtxJ